MAEYKLYNLKDPKTGQEEPQISSREEFEAIKQKVPSTNIKNPRTGQEGSAESVVREGGMNSSDSLNVAMDVAKCLRDALREHGDEIKSMALGSAKTTGTIIKVQYMPDEQGNADEDRFVFHWDGNKLILGSYNNPVEICDLQKQSGTVTFQKDIAKNALLNFLKSHDSADSSQIESQPVDPNALPDGPVAEENLWESEECQNAFCDAVDMYRQAKSKESIKNLFRAARPYQKGNTIQEKLKGAVEWYNLYKENPPKNTKEQVFLEDDDNLEEGYVPGVIAALQKISEGLDILKTYINRTEDTHLGAYYRELESKYESLFGFCRRQMGGLHGFDDKLSEVWDVNDPIANGEDKNPGNDDFNQKWEDYDDEPVVHEGDEWGPEVGDDIDYEGGHYKLYGYCGHEVVLQNVDDERDFKVVKPEQAGIGVPEKDLEETNWVDPEELPDDETQRI